MQKIIALIMLTTLIGCASDAPSAKQATAAMKKDTSTIAKAKSYLSNKSFSPHKAEFRKVRVTNKNVVCGEINGQTVARDFTGFLPFYYQEKNGKVFARVQPKDGAQLALFKSIFNAHCK